MFTAKRKSAISPTSIFGAEILALSRRTNCFLAVAADWGNGYILTGSGEPVQLLGGKRHRQLFRPAWRPSDSRPQLSSTRKK